MTKRGKLNNPYNEDFGAFKKVYRFAEDDHLKKQELQIEINFVPFL